MIPPRDLARLNHAQARDLPARDRLRWERAHWAAPRWHNSAGEAQERYHARHGMEGLDARRQRVRKALGLAPRYGALWTLPIPARKDGAS